VLSYPSGMTVSSRALGVLSDALRAHRNQRRTRWRKLPPGRQALLVVAHPAQGRDLRRLACGFTIGTSTVYRYIREALDLLAAMAPTLEQAIEVARRKAFVILDGTLLRIDRVGMASDRDRAPAAPGAGHRLSAAGPRAAATPHRHGDAVEPGGDEMVAHRMRAWKGYAQPSPACSGVGQAPGRALAPGAVLTSGLDQPAVRPDRTRAQQPTRPRSTAERRSVDNSQVSARLGQPCRGTPPFRREHDLGAAPRCAQEGPLPAYLALPGTAGEQRRATQDRQQLQESLGPGDPTAAVPRSGRTTPSAAG
jgi:hypothetical protein